VCDQQGVHLKTTASDWLQQSVINQFFSDWFGGADIPHSLHRFEIKGSGFRGESAEKRVTIACVFVKHIRAFLQQRGNGRNV
jgi:hypothetical protein